MRVAISEAHGLRCAEEVVTARPLPGFDQAAIDGYAVRSVDLAGATEIEPVTLPVVGEIPAGSRQPLRLQPRQAVRVAAGAPLPTLADAVVPVGYTDAGSARLTVHQGVPSAAFVRRVGEDVQPGDVAVRRDAVIGAAQVALLAAAGRDKVLVHPKPRVSVISVGDELVDLARTPGAGQVADVCSHALTAAAREAGAETSRAGLVRGDAREIARRDPGPAPVQRRHRRVRGRRRQRGCRGARRVRRSRRPRHHPRRDAPRFLPGLRPARPRRRSDLPVPVVPGHRAAPVRGAGAPAAARSRSAVPTRTGACSRPGSPRRSAPPPGRRGYLRGRLLREQATGEYLVQPLGTSGTHLLSSISEANGLIVLPENVTEATVDEVVSVAFLPAPA